MKILALRHCVTEEHVAEYECQFRSHLACGVNQRSALHALRVRAERKRNNFRWVAKDGANAGAVSMDIAYALSERGLPWLRDVSNPANALALIESMKDSFVKFSSARQLATLAGDGKRFDMYDRLAEADARRTGRSLHRATWSSL